MRIKNGSVCGAFRPTAQRQQRGAILIASVLIVFALIMLALPILIFFANLSTQLTLQNQASSIALQTARIVDSYRWWLDAPRPGFDADKASTIAASAARSMCDACGFKNAEARIRLTKDDDGNDLTVCDLKVDGSERLPSRADVFGFHMGSYFTGKIAVTASTSRSKANSQYSIIHFDAPTVEDQSQSRPLGYNRRDVAILPAYGFGNYMAAGQSTSATPYGSGPARDLQPDYFFAMNYYHLKKSDIDYVSQTGQAIPIAGWHPVRHFEGKKLEFK